MIVVVVVVVEGGGSRRQYRPISLALQIVRKSIRRRTKRREDNAEARLLGDVTLQTRSRWAGWGCWETGTTDRSCRADPGGWDGMWVKATRDISNTLSICIESTKDTFSNYVDEKINWLKINEMTKKTRETKRKSLNKLYLWNKCNLLSNFDYASLDY